MAGALEHKPVTPARRFYSQVHVREAEGDFDIALDQRTLKTPRGKPFRAPTRKLAVAMAAEWDAQAEHIAPVTMPLSQLAFAAVDFADQQEAQSAALLNYLDTDLVRHRATEPAGLVARQAAHWDPVLDWAQSRFHARLPVVSGVIAAETPTAIRTVFAWEIDDLDHFRRTGLAQATTLAGSLLIGFAVLEGRLDGRQAFEAAALDTLWNLERWGEDAEARAVLDRLERDLVAAARFAEALSD